MSTVADLLRRARARIADEAHWTQWAFARKRGVPVGADNQEADQWCARGAIFADAADAARWPAMTALESLVPDTRIAEFNDNHTHAEVLALFDRAIVAVEDSK